MTPSERQGVYGYCKKKKTLLTDLTRCKDSDTSKQPDCRLLSKKKILVKFRDVQVQAKVT